MALSLSNFLFSFVILCLSSARAKTITYDFNITWVTTNPDGAFDRPTIGINGQWPIPIIRSSVGDQVIVNVQNQLGNQSTSLHFHGMFQNGTTEMDGVGMATQCPIPPGSSFTYNFTTNQPGTYWYHSHVSGQYPDGIRGPLIIDDPDSPHKGKWDHEAVLTLSDWYHDQMPGLIKDFLSLANPGGAEPVPNSALMNDTQNLTVPIEPGKTYFFRIVNMGAFAAQYFWFEDHTMTVIEVDGVWTNEAKADMLYLTPAQRYGVLVTMKNSSSSNFPIVGSMDEELFDQVPDGLNSNVTSWLVYDDKKPLPEPKTVDEFAPFDDFQLTPSDGIELFENVDHTITLDVKMDNLGDGANYAFFNNITYVKQKVPSLYTAISAPEDLATNPSIYSLNTNPFILSRGEVVEIVVNNNDPGKHPFHLHGHNFQAVVRSPEEAGNFNNTAAELASAPKVPMRRDTFLVHPNGNMVLRFRADNPGVWLFHCHIEWHVDSGLIATMIEDPISLQAQKKLNPIPQSHFDACRAGNMKYEGNAGGNLNNFLDLSAQNAPPKPLPTGFTAKGIVALVFSTVAAAIGIAVIVWYGLGEIEQPNVGDTTPSDGSTGKD